MQGDLFGDKLPTNQPNEDFLYQQLIKLGDMMGDGLHHEADGKWIPKEYKRVLKQIDPDIFKEQRKRQAESINKQMAVLLAEKKCTCGGTLRQGRSGSKICYCTACDKRYTATSKKREQ